MVIYVITIELIFMLDKSCSEQNYFQEKYFPLCPKSQSIVAIHEEEFIQFNQLAAKIYSFLHRSITFSL